MRSRTLLLLPLIAYLVLPTRNFYWDGVSFAIEIEKHLPASALVHPSHLIYAVWGAWLYELSNWLGLHWRALYLMQAANCVLAAVAVVLVYRCFRTHGWSNEQGLTGALIFGFSATWWKFATDADAYIPAIVLLLIAYLLLQNPRMVWLAGLVNAAAMLFHELAILFVPVAMFLLWRRSAVAAYCAIAIAPVGAAYAWAYQAARPPASFLGWITSHSADSSFAFNPLKDLAYTLRGTLRLFFGGRWPDLVPNFLSIAACIFLATAVIGFVTYTWRALPLKWPGPPVGLICWIGVYGAFLFFWMPQNTFYRLFYLAPLVMILLPEASRVGSWFVVVLALWNFAFLVYPESRVEFNAPLRFAMAQHDKWPPGTPIVFERFHPDLWTISYFNPQASWIGMEQADLGALDRDLVYAHDHNQPLWLEQTAYDLFDRSPDGQAWLKAHERPAELVRFKDQKHEFVFHAMH